MLRPFFISMTNYLLVVNTCVWLLWNKAFCEHSNIASVRRTVHMFYLCSAFYNSVPAWLLGTAFAELQRGTISQKENLPEIMGKNHWEEPTLNRRTTKRNLHFEGEHSLVPFTVMFSLFSGLCESSYGLYLEREVRVNHFQSTILS